MIFPGFAEASRIMQIKPEPNVTSTDDSTLQSDHNPKGVPKKKRDYK